MKEIHDEIKSIFDKIVKTPMPLTFNEDRIECHGIFLETDVEKKGISPRDVKVYYVTTSSWKYGSYDEPPFEDIVEICKSNLSGVAIVEFVTACIKLEIDGLFQARQNEHEEKLVKEIEKAEKRFGLI